MNQFGLSKEAEDYLLRFRQNQSLNIPDNISTELIHLKLIKDEIVNDYKNGVMGLPYARHTGNYIITSEGVRIMNLITEYQIEKSKQQKTTKRNTIINLIMYLITTSIAIASLIISSTK